MHITLHFRSTSTTHNGARGTSPVSNDRASHLTRHGATDSLLESYWSDGSIPSIEGKGLFRRHDESCPTLIELRRGTTTMMTDVPTDQGCGRLHNDHDHGYGHDGGHCHTHDRRWSQERQKDFDRYDIFMIYL